MLTPIVYSVRDACEIAHAGKTTLYAAIKAGRLRARKRGRSTLFLRDDLLQWVADFPSVQTGQSSAENGGIDNV